VFDPRQAHFLHQEVLEVSNSRLECALSTADFAPRSFRFQFLEGSSRSATACFSPPQLFRERGGPSPPGKLAVFIEVMGQRRVRSVRKPSPQRSKVLFVVSLFGETGPSPTGVAYRSARFSDTAGRGPPANGKGSILHHQSPETAPGATQTWIFLTRWRAAARRRLGNPLTQRLQATGNPSWASVGGERGVDIRIA